MVNVPGLECSLLKDEFLAEPQLQWAGGAKQWVIEIGSPTEKIYLPGSFASVDIGQLRNRNDILILSERSGGSRSLLSWWERQLDSEGEPWVHIDAMMWDEDILRKNPGWSNKSALDALLELGKATDRLAGTVALNSLLKAHEGPLTVFLRDLPSLNARALAVASAFRAFRELHRQTQLRVVLISHQEYFADSVYHQSGYLPMLWQLKTRSFEVAEIEILAQAWASRTGTNQTLLSTMPGKGVFDLTGGQPLLVQRFFATIAQAKEAWRLAPQAAMAKAAQLLRSDPPEACRSWTEELKAALKSDNRLANQLHAYVRGASLVPARFPPPAFERPLFVAGWLGLDRLGRWGIRSTLHADLARQVLNQPASGREFQ